MRKYLAPCLAVLSATALAAAPVSTPRQMADTVLAETQSEASGRMLYRGSTGWKYEVGTLLDGMAAMYQATRDPRYLEYVRATVDPLLTGHGEVKEFKPEAHSLDDLEMGRAALFLYGETHDKRYAATAQAMRMELETQPRLENGGFWHKQIYPNQMWLDGAYMAEPFYAAYAKMFGEEKDFSDIVHQLLLMDEHMRDPKTGLLFHGWDESKQMAWANKTTGLSPEVWARAMGWYAMALVDVLEWFPRDHPQRVALIGALNRTAAAIVATQSSRSGLWRDVLTGPDEPANFEESSAACMFVYAMAKGSRLGWIEPRYKSAALLGWKEIERAFVKPMADGKGLQLEGTVAVSGLGGKPYRSGTYEYYIHEKVVTNDLKGLGAFLLAGSEMERLSRATK
ncbi:glycoside hydrolase family 88/105 protein [Terriglobus saanensis]|uniref:Glycosyl hydrolase family 88 n=1 Tax=Terriglobus saanensis (strain ATCC BAA-1853 / DSM 23119 / SP1PR4) TaxID=401053 RepID=E8V1Z6_TERSS|nr:glycoside hydrolase family 88 protein [Terriglobus saanensis]ADV83484.1 glycosyl hydrolase family 88 [Terriglobus saanensis SP1PR4]